MGFQSCEPTIMPARPASGVLAPPWKWALIAVLALAAVRGGRYALFLPPWGLIDEEQHLDYILSVAEEGRIPVADRSTLSPEIVASLFRTERWTTFHWTTPSGPEPGALGLEGYSFEGYQPPLYYLLMAPIFRLLPGGVLGKLFVLRLVAVALSLGTIWIIWRIASELSPANRFLALLPPLVMALLPERTMAVSRVNNDVLLELAAAGFFWIVVHTLHHGLTLQRSIALGLALGAGFLTKTSMAVLAPSLLVLLWIRRRDSRWAMNALACMIPPAALAAPWILRNLRLYGEWSGFAGFSNLPSFPAPRLTLAAALSAVESLFGNFWVVWWQGPLAGSAPGLTLARLLLLTLCILAMVGMWRAWCSRSGTEDRWRVSAIILGLTLVLAYALAVLYAYFNGQIPVIQGRFFLPVTGPIVLGLSYGLWHAPLRRLSLALLLLVLLALDLADFFGNLIPWFYLTSQFFQAGQPLVLPPLTLGQAWAVAWPALLADKPVLLRPWLWVMLPLEIAVLAGCAWAVRRLALQPMPTEVRASPEACA
jgi:hypothetical protein